MMLKAIRIHANFKNYPKVKIPLLIWSGLILALGLIPFQAKAFEPFQSSKDLGTKGLKTSDWVSQADPSQNQFPQTGPPPESLPPKPLEPEEEIPTPTPELIPETTEPSLERVNVQQIVIAGSTVFSQDELQEVISSYVGQSLSVADLQAAADVVTQLYIRQGYITSRATLQEQTLVDGVVEIQIIEGQLEEIQVIGTEQLANYIRSRVGLGVGKPLNQRDLEDQLRLLQIDSLFDRIKASLRPGTTSGSTILVIEAEVANPFSGSTGIDTLSPRSTGEYRLGANLQLRNLVGLGDTLFTSAYRTTTGGSESYELGYRIPLNPMNGTLQFRIAPSFFRVTDPNELGFLFKQSGSTDIYEVDFRQPLVRTPREEFALSLGFRYRQGSTLTAGIVLPPTTTSTFSFGQDYTRRDFSGAWAVRSQFRLGTGLFDASAPPNSRGNHQFFSWLGEVQRFQVLSPDNILILTANAQITPDQLLSSEQFYIGGKQSVRGYYQNARFGDNGVRLSVENRIALLREDDGRTLVEAVPFVDLGYVWNNQTASFLNQNFLIGTGVGFTLNPLPSLSTNLDFGIPLISLNQISADLPSGLRVYFDVRYRF